jgi:hypothetical protein
MKPITTRVMESRSNTTLPKGMEISISADGSGRAVPKQNEDTAGCCGKGDKCKCKTKVK